MRSVGRLLKAPLLALLPASILAAGPAWAGGIFFTNSPDGADVVAYIITNSDDISQVACWVSKDEIDSVQQPNDLKLYVTKDANATATWIAIVDDPSEADPVQCLKSN